MSGDAQIDIRSALLARLRFERAMGLETIPAPRGIRTVAPASAPIPANALNRATPNVSSIVPQAPIQAPKPSASAPPPMRVASIPAAATGDIDARWQSLETRAKACAACGLHQGRTHVVFGSGNRQAQIVFVGEGPGADEDAQGLPFVGPSGELLTKIIMAIGLTRDDVYICNVVKCRPKNNLPPLPDEVAACNAYLVEQLELINPKVIVALGGPALKTLCKTTQGIAGTRGRWHSYRGIPVMPTLHPAFVLHQYTDANRRAVWEDMKAVLAKVKQ